MSEQPPPQFPSFDQIVKGNVCIKKLSKDKYRITFSKIGKFLLYQMWDKDSVNLNKKRSVGYVSAKQWIKAFKGYNKELEIIGKPLFTPTTIMETEDCNYAFVIHTAYLNSCGHVVFTVSTNEISISQNSSHSQQLTQLSIGHLKNVRFDIDSSDFCTVRNIYSYVANFAGACSVTPIKTKYSINIIFYFNAYPLKNCSIFIPVFPEIQTNPSQVKYINFYKNERSFIIDVDFYQRNNVTGYDRFIYKNNNDNFIAQHLKDFMDNFSPIVDRTNDDTSYAGAFKYIFKYIGIQINFNLLDSNKNLIYNYTYPL